MKLVVQDDMNKMCEWIANYICKKINECHPNERKYFVIGLPACQHLLPMYDLLVKLYKENKVSFKYIKAFHTDEYVKLPNGLKCSNHTAVFNMFSKHVDINPDYVFMLNGNAADLKEECQEYERRIAEEGGMDLCLVNAGDDGEVGFNECDSSLMSKTREVKLSERTKQALADREFTGRDCKVPTSVLTLGIGTIMNYADEVIVITSGPKRSRYVHCAIEKGVNYRCGISIFQMHPKAMLICDKEATYDLTVRTVESAITGNLD